MVPVPRKKAAGDAPVNGASPAGNARLIQLRRDQPKTPTALRMTTAIRQLFYWMPFLFGIGFIAPLIAQMLEYWQVEAPWGLGPVMFGLLIGAPWGLYATLRGRWL